MNPETIGYMAAILTTAAYVPQALKVAREKHTKGISLCMFSLVTAGIGLWFVYGLLINSPSVILANGISFLLSLFILLMKVRHG